MKQVFHYVSGEHIFQLPVLKLQVLISDNTTLACEACPLHIILQDKPPYHQSHLCFPKAKDKLFTWLFRQE